MKTTNRYIASLFEQVALLLELKGDNPFRIRAYREAADLIKNHSESFVGLVDGGQDLTEFQGIGDDLAEKIQTIIEKGKLPLLEKLKKDIPSSLMELTYIPGLGPKKVKTLYHELGIKNLSSLEKAAKNGEISELKGFGEKSEKKILKNLKDYKKLSKEHRFLWMDAHTIVNEIQDYFSKSKVFQSMEVAGSYRRKKETVGDLDILITAKDANQAMKAFKKYPDVRDVASLGETKSSFVLNSDMQVDVRVVPKVSLGAALHYFTGSKAHNVALRKKAVGYGFKVNEYGIYKGDERIAGKTEKEFYRCLKLPYIEPELRENLGEIEAAEKNQLPKLIDLDQLKGDLHCHTTFTDGHNTLEEMAERARKLGHEYLAITDHSKRSSIAGGLKDHEFEEQMELIDQYNKKQSQKNRKFRLLKGCEVDILENGELDIPDSLLKEMDVVVGSVHYSLNQSRQKMTSRLLKALDNPYLNILGHPTSRLIDQRLPVSFDKKKVFQKAKKQNVFLEINSQPKRLDLNDSDIHLALELGVNLVISTDAHSVEGLGQLFLGIAQARRGWCEKSNILNTKGLRALRKSLKK